MSTEIEKLAVLFADVCGSTSLYERMGDVTARKLIYNCLSVLLEKVSKNNGTLIKTIGDEIMCSFPTAENAINAACEMQNTIENSCTDEEIPMHVRIGCHYGEVISEDADIFGDTVNVAARIASITRAAQILTTRAAAEQLPDNLRSMTHQIMRAELKGKHEQLDVYRVSWEPDDALSTRIGLSTFRKAPSGDSELNLHYRGSTLIINKDKPSIVIGRADNCDMTVESDFASRQHAKIELRFGKFVIIDHSTNCTFIRFTDSHTVRLSREDLVLRGTGTIILGQPKVSDQTDLIEFQLTPL